MLRVLIACSRAGVYIHVRSVSAAVGAAGPSFYVPARREYSAALNLRGQEAVAPLTGLRGGQPRPPVIYHRRPFGRLLRCSTAVSLSSFAPLSILVACLSVSLRRAECPDMTTALVSSRLTSAVVRSLYPIAAALCVRLLAAIDRQVVFEIGRWLLRERQPAECSVRVP